MINQKLTPGVVNVSYLLRYATPRYETCENAASRHWAQKVGTVADAMALAKEENRQYQELRRRKRPHTRRKTVRKEMVPDWLKEEEPKEQEKETRRKM